MAGAAAAAPDHLEPDRYAPGLARAAVQDFCDEWAVDGDRRAAQLVASELVTNAVVHAGTPIDLTLRLVPPHLAHRRARRRGPAGTTSPRSWTNPLKAGEASSSSTR